MNTVDIPIGSTVYVNWYGNVVTAEVIDRAKHCTHPWSDEWIPVEMVIPGSNGKPIVPGCKNISMFHKHSVYATPDEAKAAWHDYLERWQHKRTAPVETPPVEEAAVPAGSPAGQPLTLAEAKQRYLNFKATHWDAEHNHLRIDALDEFYQLWRYCVAAKYGITLNAPLVSVDLGSPDGDHTGTMIVDSETGEILPEIPPEPPTDVEEPQRIISDKLYDQLRQELKKLTRKELRSTGSITYEDGATQMSLFD